MNKKTKYGADARQNILAGVKKIVDAIKVTLGPMGRNVVIAQSMVVDYGVHSLPIRVTKDGVSVAHAFDIDDPFEKPGVLLVKEACQKTVDQCGDGTTTCAVLLEAIASEGINLIEGGANPMELKNGIDAAVKYVVEELSKMAIPITGDVEKIRQIATVSANNDSSIGDLIAEAFKKIGDDGVIDIEASKSTKTEIKLSDGLKVDRGWISPYFINNPGKQICEYEDPLILLYDKRIIHHTQIQLAMQIAAQQQKPVLIICEDVDEEGLAFLNMNVVKGIIRVCAIKAPGFADSRREQMEDIAILTGASYMSDLKGLDIKKIQLSNFGNARKVICSKDETIIIGGESDKVSLEHLLNELRMNLAQAKTEEDKFPIEKRIARLTGGVAVIHVGGATETEMKERLDRFDDAVRATKSALQEGFVPGAGTAFLKVTKILHPKKTDFNAGFDIIMSVLPTPLKQICSNAGVASDTTLKNVDDENRMKGGNDFGYNAKTNKVEDLVQSGVIDPAKVLRCALQNAASAASMILTCEAEIVDTL